MTPPEVREVGKAEHLDAHSTLYRELLERDKRFHVLIEELLHRRMQPGSLSQPGRALPPQVPLTSREIAILQSLVAGRTNRQIGAQLNLGAGTVRNYLGRIFRKLGVSTRTQAALRAVELGLVRLGDMPTPAEQDRADGDDEHPYDVLGELAQDSGPRT